MSKNYYEILGIAEFETAENIKIAYRKLARKYHPDIAGNTSDALLRFKEINEAYEILSNNIKREEYDRARRFYNYAKETKKDFNINENKHNKGDTNNSDSNKFNWENFFYKKNTKNYKQEEQPKPQKGKDVFSDIEITSFEAFYGTTKTINMLQTQVCHKCNGRKFANGTICSYCKGKGSTSEYKKFNIKIPAGIKNNSKIRLANEGEKGLFGGKNGDLYITIHIKDLNKDKTEGLNIHKTIAIAPYEAVLGTNKTITTSNGNFSVKIAPMTQNGQKIRLSNCGFKQNNIIGDMILTVEIQIPQNLSKSELDLYKKLAELASTSTENNI